MLTINADQQKNLINDNESEILLRLRKAFNNKELKFAFEVIEETEIENRPLKPHEKYLKLKELNPSIEYFKEKFDLDFNL